MANNTAQVEEQVQCPECELDAVQIVDYQGDERWWTCTGCGAEITEYDQDRWGYEG
ncbi:MAG TPA: hypothetical protein VFT75_18560 [Nocardioidaceae bacterium]|nr:hypothetical protein [Nocardioidaceae bacterium]